MPNLDLIKPADLFFTTSSSIPSWVIRQRTWGKFSHVQIITGVDQEKNNLWVISADAKGVVSRYIEDGEWKEYAILTYPEITDEQRGGIIAFCTLQIGKDYDFLGLASFLIYKELQQDNKWFCSELAYVAYKQASIRLQRRVKQDFISPRDIYISPILKPLITNVDTEDWV